MTRKTRRTRRRALGCSTLPLVSRRPRTAGPRADRAGPGLAGRRGVDGVRRTRRSTRPTCLKAPVNTNRRSRRPAGDRECDAQRLPGPRAACSRSTRGAAVSWPLGRGAEDHHEAMDLYLAPGLLHRAMPQVSRVISRWPAVIRPRRPRKYWRPGEALALSQVWEDQHAARSHWPVEDPARYGDVDGPAAVIATTSATMDRFDLAGGSPTYAWPVVTAGQAGAAAVRQAAVGHDERLADAGVRRPACGRSRRTRGLRPGAGGLRRPSPQPMST